MFDLNERLDQWKRHFTSIEAMRSSDIEELEQHVRDSMAALTANGLDAEEAFVVATYRVGTPGHVGREFAKVNGSHVWSQRAFWIAAGALGYVVCGMAIRAIASFSQVMVLLAGGTGEAVGYTAAAVSCLGWMVVAASLYRRRNEHWGRPQVQKRSPGVTGSLVALAGLAVILTGFGSQIVLTRLMSVSELGQAMMVSRIASTTLNGLTPVVLLIVVLITWRHMQETRALDR